MGGAIYKDAPAIKYEERNIYLNSIQTLGRYLTPSRLNYSCLLPQHSSLTDRRFCVICSRFLGEQMQVREVRGARGRNARLFGKS